MTLPEIKRELCTISKNPNDLIDKIKSLFRESFGREDHTEDAVLKDFCERIATRNKINAFLKICQYVSIYFKEEIKQILNLELFSLSEPIHFMILFEEVIPKSNIKGVCLKNALLNSRNMESIKNGLDSLIMLSFVKCLEIDFEILKEGLKRDNLLFLNINNCKIPGTTLSEGLEKCKKLEYLDLSMSKIENVEHIFKSLERTRLKHLILKGIKLSTLSSAFLCSLLITNSEIRHLDLSYCEIESKELLTIISLLTLTKMECFYFKSNRMNQRHIMNILGLRTLKLKVFSFSFMDNVIEDHTIKKVCDFIKENPGLAKIEIHVMISNKVSFSYKLGLLLGLPFKTENFVYNLKNQTICIQNY